MTGARKFALQYIMDVNKKQVDAILFANGTSKAAKQVALAGKNGKGRQ